MTLTSYFPLMSCMLAFRIMVLTVWFIILTLQFCSSTFCQSYMTPSLPLYAAFFFKSFLHCMIILLIQLTHHGASAMRSHQKSLNRIQNIESGEAIVTDWSGKHDRLYQSAISSSYRMILCCWHPSSSTLRFSNRVIKKDLGGYPEDIFSNFSKTPIASGRHIHDNVTWLFHGKLVVSSNSSRSSFVTPALWK